MFENDENNDLIFSNEEKESVDVNSEVHVQEDVEQKTVADENTIYAAAVEEHKEKKGKGRFVKYAKFVGMAASFGIISGGLFYGVNVAADQIFKTDVVKIAETVQTPTIAVSKTDNANNGNAVMDVSGIVSNAMPAAVSITGTVTANYSFNPFYSNAYEAPVSGSGVIIGQSDTELLMVTNAHVVEDVNNLTATFIDGSTANATVRGVKSNKDIAVVSVPLSELSSDTLAAISIIDIGDSEKLQMGQPVIAIGNALGEGQSSTVGWVSALNRTITIDSTNYENLIMTDAAINPGNSGGALLNMSGQLVGINSAKYSDESIEGMGYAIPISSVADIINDLMTKEVRTKVDADRIGYLGVAGMDISESISKSYGWPVGVAITKIDESTPAAEAGLLMNDIIVGFDGEEISSFEQLRSLMEYYSSGETVKVDFYRLENGQYVLKSADVTLGNRSASIS